MTAWLLNFLAPYLNYVYTACAVTGALVYIFTVLVRIPALSKYQADADGFKAKWLALIRYLPTLGVNPQTQALEALVDPKPPTAP